MRFAACCLAACLAASAPSVRAQTSPPAETRMKAGITIELNKLEPAASACRAYFVVENRMTEPVKELRLDTFIFDGAGIIARRIGLTFPDLRPGRPRIVPFDLAGSACGDLGRLLVNDVLACTGASGEPFPGCGDLLATRSRTPVALDW